GHAETVKVVYDEEQLPLSVLLKLFYLIIDPTSVDKQGEDEGHQYRTGIYFTESEDEAVIAASLKQLKQNLEEEGNKEPLAIEACPLVHFYDAEEYHQKYLDKNPNGYCHVPIARILWAKTIDPLREETW
ncbi:MAG: peptide-methionine (S)-S-oxide reductase MsrA, partial [Lachnospiraceae bacterium]|nr:peptide-methionine (S)-S-oxide reductase MsrA [Lachnospiraceae bacterium]